MSNVGPGTENYEDALRRVTEIMSQHESELAEIDRESVASFRLWLDKVIQDVSKTLGIGLAKATAFVNDVFTIMGNAGRTFKRSFKGAYESSRRIQPN